MWELLGDGTCAVPCAGLGTMLVTGPGHREELIDDPESHEDIEREVHVSVSGGK